MSFTDILNELETLQKAMKPKPDEANGDEIEAGDEKITGAAPDEAVAREEKDRQAEEDEKAEGEEEEEDEGEEEDETDEKKGEPFGKSFSAVIDGEEVEAYDATLVLKSFDERISETEKLTAIVAKLTQEVGELRVALAADSLKKAVSVQTDLLKSLIEQVGSLRKEGTGRKSVLNVHEKPSLAAPQTPMTPSSDELLTKAEIAMRQGRLSALDVSRIETYLGRGLQVPAELTRHLI